MKKIVAPLLIGATISSSLAADSAATLKALEQQVEALKSQIAELKANQEKMSQSDSATTQEDVKVLKKEVAEIKAHDAGDNIKWDIDFRTAYDYLNYRMNNTGIPDLAKKQHNSVWTNKLILGMSAAPFDNLVFRGSLAAYKAYGQTNIAQSSYFQNFDWFDTNKPNDSTIRLREAYFLYMGDMGIPYTVSFGRRPSLDGFLANLRADQDPASPTGHNINMQFDGASFKFDFDELLSVPGAYVKLCLGRGFSETTGSYSMNMSTMGFNPGYVNDNGNPDMDMAGLIVQFVDNGQFKLMGNYYYAKNLMDMDIQGMNVGQVMTPMGPQTVMQPAFKFTDVGDMMGGALSLQVSGIGEGISDFLDDTVLFVSYAFSRTDPNENQVGAINPMAPGGMGATSGMLGSTENKVGHSIYAGVQMPGFGDGHRFGLEYNHGSKYWRSFTYGEDTLVGSKLAARGNAYETYYTLPIVAKNFTAGLSYLYIDYDYTGSDTFFGWTGTPMDVDDVPGAVKSAQEVRAYLRYRY